MTLSWYGVLSARVIDTVREGAAETHHYQVRVVDDDGRQYRVAVNVQAAQAPSKLPYLAVDDFRHPMTAALPAAQSGWTKLPPAPGGAGDKEDERRAHSPTPLHLPPLPV
jgi:uncharacterized protein YukJ